ncbi:MAG: N,N-dimethylformamidase beta subunit family domain-containing protein [Hyphomicrobiaceae bacterium]
MLPLTGYADRLSVRPGETLHFHTANATGEKVSAHIVRVLCADPNPLIGGVKTEPTALPVVTLIEPKPETVPSGSYAIADIEGTLQALNSVTFTIRIYPTLKLPRRQVIMSNRDHGGSGHDSGRGIELELTTDLKPRIRIGTHSDQASVECTTPLELHTWSTLTVLVDAKSKTLTLNVTPNKPHAQTTTTSANLSSTPDLNHGSRRVSFASASDTAPIDTFNGRLERPMIFDRALSSDEITRASHGDNIPGLVAAWDFSRDMHTNRIIDIGPNSRHGELINTPTRAVRSSSWSGHEHCFRHAPDQYAAIHFHDDDLDDCRWPATHAITIPQNFKSDAYALILKAGDTEENIPFFVVPPKGKTTAKIAVLVSTYTYTVYGNHARPEWMLDEKWRAAWIAQSQDWNAYPYNPGQHRDYGLSTYNYHTDGSGIGLVSWRRPMLNLRIGYLTYPYPDIRASGLRHYPADSHLLMWLAHKGYDVDLITDFELHHEGLDLLKNYKVVVTGSHPEYHTPQMLDALESYRDSGGRLMYLGGNGFYWKIALDPSRDGLVEIRRAEGGIRAWAAEPGEYYNQYDAEYGGLWRRNARPPQKLVGIGFTAQGNFVGSHYRIKPDARSNPIVSWIFDGISADTIGGDGFSGHGAAGFELDRADKRLGTPDNAVILASSENHPPEAPWVVVPEEQLTHITTISGETHKQLIRADMLYFDVPGGGAVFATGSITFCGALPHNNFDNDISHLLTNILNRFST